MAVTVTWIGHASFRIAGTEAVVYIDELKLTNEFGGPGPLIRDDEFFGLLREDIEALAATREAAAAGDYGLAKKRLLEYMRSRETPVWTFDWRDWDKQRNPKFSTARADRVCEHVFGWFGREADLGPDIDWTTNGFDPEEPAYTPEWTYDLNRFGFWRDLGIVLFFENGQWEEVVEDLP